MVWVQVGSLPHSLCSLLLYLAVIRVTVVHVAPAQYIYYISILRDMRRDGDCEAQAHLNAGSCAGSFGLGESSRSWMPVRICCVLMPGCQSPSSFKMLRGGRGGWRASHVNGGDTEDFLLQFPFSDRARECVSGRSANLRQTVPLGKMLG